MYTQTTLFGKHVYIEAPEKQTEGYSTDDQVVSLSDPQGLQGVEVVDLVHCGVQFCALPRGVGRSASGLHIYIYISRFLIVSYWCLVV